jgi:hypothetical protein
MLGFQPVVCAGMVMVQNKVVGNELVRKVSLYELSLVTKLLYFKWLEGIKYLMDQSHF